MDQSFQGDLDKGVSESSEGKGGEPHSSESEAQLLRRAQEAIQRKHLSFLCRCPCLMGSPVDFPGMYWGRVQCQQEELR